MAKTYIGTVKYEIHGTYEVDGVVEKPDIVGAIFGQSEGLLGEDMDLKELQQNGKIGRIEISVKKGKGKTHGEIIIPSSLDRVKTSILAAAMETVEKVGPCTANVNVKKIIDTRKDKREKITSRAQQLLKQMMKFEGAESDELADTIRTGVRTGKIITIDGLSAGPEVKTNRSIIVVEGRADVLKLLGYGIKNAVAMDGSNISRPLIELCKNKVVTMLIDGDRGGELNAKKLSQLTKVDYVAIAPDGKEAEELTQKEILQALKKRQTSEEFFGKKPFFEREKSSYPRRQEGYRQDHRYSRPRYGQDNRRDRQRSSFRRSDSDYPRPFERREPEPAVIPDDILALKKDMDSLKGKLKARLYDGKKRKIKDVQVKELLESLKKGRKKTDTIVFDGIITKRLVDAAEEKGIKNIVGVKKGVVSSTDVNLYTL